MLTMTRAEGSAGVKDPRKNRKDLSAFWHASIHRLAALIFRSSDNKTAILSPLSSLQAQELLIYTTIASSTVYLQGALWSGEELQPKRWSHSLHHRLLTQPLSLVRLSDLGEAARTSPITV
jgi:hypothetical protein